MRQVVLHQTPIFRVTLNSTRSELSVNFTSQTVSFTTASERYVMGTVIAHLGDCLQLVTNEMHMALDTLVFRQY